ncbi:Multidrug/pheromone exporter, ABC superfamily [Phaffia rhodozyma]|uniref:Multidrug/pheromone exporter, ABC superfamily n=1 Tax=Phaffia rhodozyma TaxID=264483 RepID=A0A0F7SQF8_PHARH|nr:Multidrug/pheromone exporter, ABC superfamily [Phaffia rhodozyma]
MSPPLLSVKDIAVRRDNGTGSAIFEHVSFDVEEGDIVVIKGRSGSGKTTLLKCISQLTLYQAGSIHLSGKTPQEMGVPKYRTLVAYVPQRPSLLPDNPTKHLEHVKTFGSRREQSGGSSSGWFGWGKKGVRLEGEEDERNNGGDQVLDPMELAKQWDIQRPLWDRNWGDLSGGESQRINLACAFGRGNGLGSGPQIVLLDEPTSALDPESASKVEASLLELLPPSNSNPSGKGSKTGTGPKAYILITHSEEQAERFAGKGAKVIDLGDATGNGNE